VDLLTNAESVARLEEIVSLYMKARRLSMKTFPGRDISAVEDEINRIKEMLEEARCDPEFRLGVRS